MTEEIGDISAERREILLEIDRLKAEKDCGWKGTVRFLLKRLAVLDDPFRENVDTGSENRGRKMLARHIRPL